MKKILFLALALSACAPIAPIATVSVPPVAANSAAVACGLAAGTLLDEKALYGAEAAYNVPASAYVELDSQHLLSASVKASIKPLLINSFAALKVARAAYSVGSACGYREAIANAISFGNQAKALLPARH